MADNMSGLAAAAIMAFEMDSIDEEELLLSEALSRKRKKKRKHTVWSRVWLDERMNGECNTSYKLQKRLLECDLKEFRRMIRMPPEVFDLVLEAVRPYIQKYDTNYRKAITCEERLSMTLKYYATGEPLSSLSTGYRVGYSTVSNILKETSIAIVKALGHYIKLPNTTAEWEQVMSAYDQRWNYPGCLGAIDGKHIRIMRPWTSGSTFFNYKKFFSIVLLAIVNANYEFLYINVGAEGRLADGGLWRDSDVYEAMKQGKLNLPEDFVLKGTNVRLPAHFIADDAFAMSSRLLKPFAQRMRNDRDEIFNYRLSRARRVVENVFGICSSRFRVLRGEICMHPDSAENVVMAICVLHNVLRRHCGRSYMPHTSVDHEDNNYIMHPGVWRFEKDGPLPNVEADMSRNPLVRVKLMRETLADYLMTPQGEVHWQYEHLHNKLDKFLENIHTVIC